MDRLPSDACVFLWVHSSGETSHFHPSHLEGYVESEWDQSWFITDEGGIVADGPFDTLLEAADALVPPA